MHTVYSKQRLYAKYMIVKITSHSSFVSKLFLIFEQPKNKNDLHVFDLLSKYVLVVGLEVQFFNPWSCCCSHVGTHTATQVSISGKMFPKEVSSAKVLTGTHLRPLKVYFVGALGSLDLLGLASLHNGSGLVNRS